MEQKTLSDETRVALVLSARRTVVAMYSPCAHVPVTPEAAEEAEEEAWEGQQQWAGRQAEDAVTPLFTRRILQVELSHPADRGQSEGSAQATTAPLRPSDAAPTHQTENPAGKPCVSAASPPTQ